MSLQNFHENRKPMQCKWKECRLVFPNIRALLNHVRRDHDIKNSCYWGDCTFYTDGVTIRNHVKMHFAIIEAVCKLCPTNKSFKWRFDLKKHLLHFHPNSEIDFENLAIDGFDIRIARRKVILPDSLSKIME